MAERGFTVPPMGRADLAAHAKHLRELTGRKRGKFPIVPFVELGLRQLFPRFEMIVVDRNELKDEHALFRPADWQMIVREDVYVRACDGHGRDRLTLAHEVGHVLLHRNVPMARALNHKTYCDSEWQANAFAGELLMPADEIVLCSSAEEAAERFGVSLDAAKYQRQVHKRKSPSQ